MLDRFTWIRQAALRWAGEGRTVYIDPWGVGDDDPPADLILITHAHGDHFAPDDIERIRGGTTKLVAPHDVAAELSGDVTPVAPGESHEIAGVRFTTVPAYNVEEERLDMHPKENRWVGYVLDLGGSTYYHAGDTDHAPELDELRADVAFLPIGGTYTMDPVQAGGLARSIAPQLAVPMHYGFVVGSPSDAERFRKEADPVKVEVLTPTNPFERP
ncbi:MAG TPA: MBL fold metallo-hydrolase [Actinomycetota bacterium]|jgi:L-ascorbate metabolism protein UlaG (beta-lactamase superfamily)